MKLTKEKIDIMGAAATTESEVVIGAYKLVIEDWDNVEAVNGWPKISKATWECIGKWAVKYGSGLTWMNNGFGVDESMADWTVTPCDVTYKKAS